MIHFDQFPAHAAKPTKRLSETPMVHPSVRMHDVKLGAWTDIGPNSMLSECSLGDYSYLAGDAQIIYSEIGRYCSIASHVRINPGNHPMGRVTQHHMTYRRVEYGLDDADDAEFFEWRREHKCVIGHDVWIGHAAVIMPGVMIGTGAVIGSGAIVTKDVAPYAIVGGVPAHHIRMRFDEATIVRIMNSEWWNWDRETLLARWHELLNVNTFAPNPPPPPAAPGGMADSTKPFGQKPG